MKYLSLLGSFVILLMLGLASCDSTGTEGATGTLQVNLTDAPADYDSVNVTINSVQVHMETEETEADTGEETEEGEESWVTVLDQQMKVNLLELANGNEISLGTQEVEAGRYSQIRFILGTENSVTIDGETYPLQTPSGQETGLKLNIDAEVEENTTYSMLVDFDAARSVVELGNGQYLLQPVLRAVNQEETGSISGSVTPADFKTHVLAVSEGDTVSSTITSDSGNFELMGLPEATYEVVFDPNSDQYSTSSRKDVSVTAEEETELGTIEL